VSERLSEEGSRRELVHGDLGDEKYALTKGLKAICEKLSGGVKGKDRFARRASWLEGAYERSVGATKS